MLGCNGRPDARGRETDTSGIAGSPCSGAGRRILPAAAGLLPLRVATTTQGRPHATAVVFVRNSGGSSATFCALPVCGDQPAHARSCRRDHARSVHTRVRACHREDGVFAAVRPGQDAVVGIPAARRRSGGGDDPPPDPASGRSVGTAGGIEPTRCAGGRSASNLTLHRRRSRALGSQLSGSLVRGDACPVSNDDGKQVVFNSMPAEADRQRDQLRGVLHGLGAAPGTPLTILSDGAEGPRSLGEAACVGPTRHVLDWFHLSMRIQHVAQATMSWPDASAEDRKAGSSLAETIERIKWRLWHGQVRRGLDLIAETMATLEATTETASPATLKVTRLLGELESYVCGQSDIIMDEAAPGRRDEPISTAVTESTVQWLVHRRMNAQQQMRWTPRGAHLMLKVRCAVMNGSLQHDHAVAEGRTRRPFRRAA